MVAVAGGGCDDLGFLQLGRRLLDGVLAGANGLPAVSGAQSPYAVESLTCLPCEAVLTFRSSEWRRAALICKFGRLVPAAIAHLAVSRKACQCVRKEQNEITLCDDVHTEPRSRRMQPLVSLSPYRSSA